MITFNYETDFSLDNENIFSDWIQSVIVSENKQLGEINYIFCGDEYLHNINLRFLNHDTYTDIISFDYSQGNIIAGDIYISIERIRVNADEFRVSFEEELKRVMVHGVLHYIGYKDKTNEEKTIMRNKENQYLIK